jgi:hypothetical protein
VRSIAMIRGVVGLLAVLCTLLFAIPGWGTGKAEVKLLDLNDRDVVVLSVDGQALTSELVVHKLHPSRLEAFYKYDGPLPVVTQTTGDLVKQVSIEPRGEGFMMTLALADSVPVESESIYREAVVEDGVTALEVFAQDSSRAPFALDWLDPASAPAAATPVATSAVPAATPAGSARVSFDAKASTLTIAGVSEGSYEITKQQFPPRVDVLLHGAADPGLLGLVHKDLNGPVTFVEVVDAKATQGQTVRATLAADMGLVNQTMQDGKLVLTFGKQTAPLMDAPKAQPLPATQSESKPFAPALQPKAQPLSSTPLDSALGAAAGGFAPQQMAGPTGLGGEQQDVPSVEQVLTMAREDAMRYGKDASKRNDQFGTYEIKPMEGTEGQLSDVRVNLSAAGGYSLYQFLMFLSSISGISIIIDPYWLDEPFGTVSRAPKDPGFLPSDGGGPGFRPSNIFDPQLNATGTVRGNFDNVPFDQALDLVLSTHMLEKVVYRDDKDPYGKPIILITSKERKEQELKGQNQIDLYQLHYADPSQIWEILYQLNLLPSVTVGWYVYQGDGGNNSGGGNGGGGNGGGNGGGGRRNSASVGNEVTVASTVRDNIFSPLETETPLQGVGGGSSGGSSGGGGGRGGGGGGNGGGGGRGGGGGNGGNGSDNMLYTAKTGLVVMRGTRETLDTVQSLIAKIDKPPKQVAMKVKVYQVSSDPELVYGLLRATAQDDRITSNYELGSLNVNVLPKGGVLLDENYSAAFEFLQTQRDAELITETEVAVIDGYEADISNTRTRGQLSGTLVITPDGQVINQPQFNSVSVGMDLTFTPQIDDRGRITMDLDVSLSNFDGAEQTASANGQQVTFQPTVQTDLTTTLRMVDGQTAMIGGLTTSEDSTTFNGIPFVSKLPIIGQFFGRTQKVRNSSHIFITIQANIIDDK